MFRFTPAVGLFVESNTMVERFTKFKDTLQEEITFGLALSM
jgi:ethanolamine transporter EutH